jgi:hypothetical protein
MQAIIAEFPNVVFFVYHGPHLSKPKTPADVIAGQAPPGDESNLTGALFAGFLAGLGPEAQLTDGGEAYAHRTAEDFHRSYDWRKTGLPSFETASAFIPPELRAVSPQRVGIAYGVSNLPFPSDRDEMTQRIMCSTLANALRHADRYVWHSTYQHNWLISGDMPRCWVEAVEGARAAVGLP